MGRSVTISTDISCYLSIEDVQEHCGYDTRLGYHYRPSKNSDKIWSRRGDRSFETRKEEGESDEAVVELRRYRSFDRLKAELRG